LNFKTILFTGFVSYVFVNCNVTYAV